MLTSLRSELTALFAQAAPGRRPALRRANDDAWLFASDLPQVVDHDGLACVMKAARERGYTVQEANGWLYIDHELLPPMATGSQETTGEVACVISLLERHPSPCVEKSALRALAKAREQGTEKVEALCRRWHADFAQRLRRHEALPSHLISYLYPEKPKERE